MRIACRVRDAKYLAEYADQFTIRAGRPSGAQTELQKMIAGWGDFILYGFRAADGSAELDAWVLGDLSIFRLWFNQQLMARHGQPPGTLRGNRDGSSSFRAFEIGELPPSFVRGRRSCLALVPNDPYGGPFPWSDEPDAGIFR